MDLAACERDYAVLAQYMKDPRFQSDSMGRSHVGLIHHRIMTIWVDLIHEFKNLWYLIDPNDGVELTVFVGPRRPWMDACPARYFRIFYKLTRSFGDALYAEGKSFEGPMTQRYYEFATHKELASCLRKWVESERKHASKLEKRKPIQHTVTVGGNENAMTPRTLARSRSVSDFRPDKDKTTRKRGSSRRRRRGSHLEGGFRWQRKAGRKSASAIAMKPLPLDNLQQERRRRSESTPTPPLVKSPSTPNMMRLIQKSFV